MINTLQGYNQKYEDIAIIINATNEENIKNYYMYLKTNRNEINIYVNMSGEIFNIKDDKKIYINCINDLNCELIILINDLCRLEYILENIKEIKVNMKQRALSNILIGYDLNVSKYYDLDNIDSIIKNISYIDIIVRKSYLKKNNFKVKELNLWKSKIFIKDLLSNSFLYIYSINQSIDEIENVYEYEYLFSNSLNMIESNKEQFEIFNEKVFVKLFNKICSILGKLGTQSDINNFIDMISKYKKILSKYKLNILDENISNFINELDKEPRDNIKKLLWYRFYIKSIYTCRIYDIREDKNSITYYCVLHSEIMEKIDNKLINNIEFYFNSPSNNKKIYLKKEYGDKTFYIDDYPHKKYINNKDNFTLTLDKNKLTPGDYELTYEFLNKNGRVVLSNFALARKLDYKIIRKLEEKMIMKYNYHGKNIGINIELCNNISIIKKYYGLIKDDIKNIKESKQNQLYIYLIYFMYKYIKKIYNKKIILIGETHNTYQDSGKVLFEKLKDDKELKCFYVTSNKELLDKDNRYIKFMSTKHKIVYLLADILLNVQNIDIYMSPFINRNKDFVYKRHSNDYLIYKAFSKYLKNQKKIFLQHGVLYQAGLTNAVYINCDFDYFVVSTEFEKDIFPTSCRIPIETCLPRFSTYNNRLSNDNIILFSPTWRKFFKDLKSGSIYEDSIKKSEYYLRIKSLLNNKNLHKILEKYNYKFIYNIHHTLVDLGIDDILDNDYQNIIINKGQYNLNDLISRSNICITDYSSLFFDFLWQNKLVLNYIYDYEEFHTRIDNNKKKSRYFDLKKYNNMFYDENLLIENLEKNIKNNIVDVKVCFLCKEDPCKQFIKYIRKI